MPSVNAAKDAAREYIKLTQTNEVRLAGTVIQKLKTDGKQKMKDNLPVLDAQGNAQYYPDRFKVKVAFNGGEIMPEVSADHYAMIQEDEMYLFRGRLGLVREFGNESISYVFSTVEEL